MPGEEDRLRTGKRKLASFRGVEKTGLRRKREKRGKKRRELESQEETTALEWAGK